MGILDKIYSHTEYPKDVMYDNLFYLNVALNDCIISFTNITNSYLGDLIKKKVNEKDLIELDKALFKCIHITGFLLKNFAIGSVHLNAYINDILELRGYSKNEETLDANLYLLSQVILNNELTLRYYKYYYKQEREVPISNEYLQSFLGRCQVINFHTIQAYRLFKDQNIEQAQSSVAEAFIHTYSLIMQTGTNCDIIIEKNEGIRIFK